MALKFILIFILGLLPAASEERGEGYMLMFWNLENFFDPVDGGGGESDSEFSPTGARRWTRRRFNAKCRAVEKSLLWISSQQDRLPDVFCMAEVENRGVLEQLVFRTSLNRLGYSIVHYDSPDPRGIDCALLYRPSVMRLLSSKPCRVEAPGLRTRDILLAQFVSKSCDSLAVLVNHHPSKYGGGSTAWRREATLGRLRELGDSLASEGWKSLVALGDFNDGKDSQLFNVLGPAWIPAPVEGNEKGTIRFNGVWEFIDLCFVSPALSGRVSYFPVRIPFLMQKDAAHGGEKPFRTYSGPRYIGGVSDHLPIVVHMKTCPF